jgi:diguanylate cyclase (GGDEF)-like protein
LPGEKALQQRYRKITADRSQLSVALLEPSEVSPAQFAQSASESFDEGGTLLALQGLYQQRIGLLVHQAADALATTRSQLLVTSGISILAVLIAVLLLLRTLRRDAQESGAQSHRSELETRLHRAFDMSNTEEDVFSLVGEAVATAESDLRVEMLVADSSRAHLHQVATSNLAAPDGCPVAAPTECPAAIHGQTQIFESSTALDACPYLKAHTGAPCSAVCVPVSIAGRAMGVLHAKGDYRGLPTVRTITTLELVARRAGERLTMLRAFARSEMQAKTDPLTGLLNRRSLEASARDLAENDGSYVVAYADLDHFKVLNDVHGHDAGDRALRLFARVLRDSVRPSDIPARYGGEEFVVVLPDCGAADAMLVMERVRNALAAAVADGAAPDFTVSVGVAESSVSKTFSETVEAADAALLHAKATGRDRVAVAGGPGVVVPDDPSGLTEDRATGPASPAS